MRRAVQAVTVTVVLALLGLLIWDVARNGGGKVAKEVDSGHPFPAPLFTRPYVGQSGKLSLKSLRGKVVVLNFWESYCPPCIAEAPMLSQVSKQWQGKGVVFLGVDFQDLSGPAEKYLKRFHITYPSVSDDGPLVGHYGVTGFPETFFIDRKGVVVPAVPGGHIVGQANRQTLDAGIKNALRGE
jgi:cytochrome c biogenesis protein CcmG, thiol:disulfide interchange protein DsbE